MKELIKSIIIMTIVMSIFVAWCEYQKKLVEEKPAYVPTEATITKTHIPPKNYYEQCLRMIKTHCEEAGLEEYYTLIAAISRLETGNFTSKLFLDYNNWGGMKSNGKFKRFENKFEGLRKYIWMMKTKYISKYGNNVEAMQKRYCPGSDTWAPKVRRIMEELEEQ